MNSDSPPTLRPSVRSSGLTIRRLAFAHTNGHKELKRKTPRKGVHRKQLDKLNLSPDDMYGRIMVASCIPRGRSGRTRLLLEAQRGKRQNRGSGPADPDLRQRISENALRLMREIQDRMGAGLRSEAGTACGVKVGAFEIKGLRSKLSPILVLFNSGLYKGRHTNSRSKKPTIASGKGKAYLTNNPSKLMALDDEYIIFNRLMRRIIRIDLDRIFESVADLSQKILDLGLPSPNIIVGAGVDGKLYNPHVYYVLKHSVCFTAKGRKEVQNLFYLLNNVITDRMVPLGADRSATNTMRGKNPLCERLITAIPYDEPYSMGRNDNSVESLVDLLDIDKYRRRLESIALIEDYELRNGRPGSNALFRVAGRVSSRLIHEYHPESHRRTALVRQGVTDEAELFAEFEDAIFRVMRNYFEDSDALRKQCASTAKYYWRSFNPLIASAYRRRGAMASDPSYLRAMSKQEKQQAGGRYAARKCWENTLVRIMLAAEEIGRSPEDISVTQLAQASGVSRTTIYRHRKDFDEGRRLLAEIRENKTDHLDRIVNPRRLEDALAKGDSECHIQCLDKKAMDHSELQDCPDTGSTGQTGYPDTPQTALESDLSAHGIVKNRSRMGSESDAARVHARNPVFVLVIGAGPDALRPEIVKLRDDVSPLAYEAAVAPTLNFIDDFGRQRVAPEELLNRWVVPLDRKIEFLTLAGGRKIEIPFEMLVVFASNKDPAELVDPAFLRRIQTKIKIGAVTEEQFCEIFRRAAGEKNVSYDPEIPTDLINFVQHKLNQDLRSCYPRDIVNQVCWTARYEGKDPYIDRAALRRAIDAYFLG